MEHCECLHASELLGGGPHLHECECCEWLVCDDCIGYVSKDKDRETLCKACIEDSPDYHQCDECLSHVYIKEVKKKESFGCTFYYCEPCYKLTKDEVLECL